MSSEAEQAEASLVALDAVGALAGEAGIGLLLEVVVLGAPLQAADEFDVLKRAGGVLVSAAVLGCLVADRPENFLLEQLRRPESGGI